MKFTKLETNEEKAAYHLAMAFMYQNDVSLINAYNRENPYGGVTVAFGNVFPGSKMVEVAVSYCDVKDKYVEEIGSMLAICKFENCETVQLPIGHYSQEDQAQIIITMFTEVYRIK